MCVIVDRPIGMQYMVCRNDSRGLRCESETVVALHNAAEGVTRPVEKFSNAQFSRRTVVPNFEMSLLAILTSEKP